MYFVLILMFSARPRGAVLADLQKTLNFNFRVALWNIFLHRRSLSPSLASSVEKKTFFFSKKQPTRFFGVKKTFLDCLKRNRFMFFF